MFPRGWLFVSVILLLFAGLSGCLGSDDDPELDDDANGGDGGDGGSGGDNGGSGGDGTNGGSGGDGGDTDLADPTAVFQIVAGDTVTVGDEINFNASESNDPENETLTFSWDFGDGNETEGVNVTHSYGMDGTFNVTLTVVTEDGRNATANQTVTVELGGPPEFSASFSDTIDLPNPVLLARGGTLEETKTAGVQEGTFYVIHQVEDVPTEASEVYFNVTADDTFLQFIVFDTDGNRLASRPPQLQATDGSVKLKNDNAALGEYLVFVYSGVHADVGYTIDVSVA